MHARKSSYNPSNITSDKYIARQQIFLPEKTQTFIILCPGVFVRVIEIIDYFIILYCFI